METVCSTPSGDGCPPSLNLNFTPSNEGSLDENEGDRLKDMYVSIQKFKNGSFTLEVV